ncbi:hypothetical protein [Sphingomonas radiodurans]|uniref:hypothetical protein n=1 Tax=Sphingomonas radiodurans TaxID=2890321 RepID=UPI001E5F22FB|nr:hypothetical protein [Sphingomonas radiodurans]WBH17256.1 hypothetical protein LLW23_03870 [Sphingomonas radiodurans]
MGAERGGTDVKALMERGLVVPAVVLGVGVVAATYVAAMPQADLDLLMWRLWLPKVLAAATPPIGAFGRTLFALLVLAPFVAVAGAAWVFRTRFAWPAARKPVAVDAPTIRRADAHPDAAPRRPIRASEDLGDPLPIVTMPRARRVPEPERPLPVDLDQPLAAFDPIAVPDVPREAVRAVAPLAPTPVVMEAVLPFLAIAPEPEPVVEVVEPVVEVVGREPEPVVLASDAEVAAEPAWLVEVAPAAEAAIASEPEPEPERAVAVAVSPTIDLSGVGPASEHHFGAIERRDAVAGGSLLGPGLRRGAEGADESVSAAEVAPDGSLASLLDRLERGARKKKVPAVVEPAPVASLDDTLVMLRRLAAG